MPKANKLRLSFTYNDGLRDGELGILDAKKFDATDIIIYLLKDIGYDDTRISDFLNDADKEKIKATYAAIKKYRNDIYKVRQSRAMQRLIRAIQKSDM